MDIVTLKISLQNNKISSLKINDIPNNCAIGVKNFVFNDIFDTPKLSKLWNKLCSIPSYIYFRYNVSNLSIQLKLFNIYYFNINNKTLISNILFCNDSALRFISNSIDEINIIIRIIIPIATTANLRIPQCESSRGGYITMFSSLITSIIKIKKPNPYFKFTQIDDYDKKIKSFKMPLYDVKNKKTNFNIVFDLYPSQSHFYALIPCEIFDISKNNSYKLHFDKDCIVCVNRINGCELNMISKVLLCCICNIKKLLNDLNKFIGNNIHMPMTINTNDLPANIKYNFYYFSIFRI